MSPEQQKLLDEQSTCLALLEEGLGRDEIATRTGLSFNQVKRRLAGARKRARLDPRIAETLAQRGIVNLAGLHSGWLLEKDKETGSGQSLYFHLGPDEEKISFAEAVIDALVSMPRLEPIDRRPIEELLPPELMESVAQVLAFGAKKYAPRNWEKGMSWGRVFSALMRHMWAWWRGEKADPETGFSHLWHAGCCIAFLIAYEQRDAGTDDRPPALQKT